MTKKTLRDFEIRPYRKTDRDAILAVWERQKAEFPAADELAFPDPEHMHQFFSCVVEDKETGEVVGLGAVRAVAECGMILDPTWGGPRDRLTAAMHMFAVGTRATYANGFDWIFARIVGKVRWADRLVEKFGMTRDPWPVVKFSLEKQFGGSK